MCHYIGRINIRILKIANQPPDFYALFMTVSHIIPACQGINISLIIIQVKPRRRNHIDPLCRLQNICHPLICLLAGYLMPSKANRLLLQQMGELWLLKRPGESLAFHLTQLAVF